MAGTSARRVRGGRDSYASSLPRWLPESGASAETTARVADALVVARDAFRRFTRWLRDELSDGGGYGAGEQHLSLLVRRGHFCSTPLDVLARQADEALRQAHADLDKRVRDLGAADWPDIEARMARRAAGA